MNKPELLVPVGNFISLRAAIDAGADAVYFGIKGLNMRAGAKNFTIDDLQKISKLCNKVKKYLTLNTIIYENELEKVQKIIKDAKPFVDAIICWDLAVIELCKKYKVPFHISTQASISNSKSALFYKNLGAERIVLARECGLEQIKEIKEKVDIEVEVFVHGAMCVAVSGRCFMSQFTFGKSANRGECLQNCRREYKLQDVDKEFQLNLGTNYVMSAKDLCTISFIEKLMFIDSFKIEGRNRPAEYVKVVVQAYRQAIDNKDHNKTELIEKLKTVYNRGFSTGFYLGKPIDEFTDEYGSKATKKKQYVGKVNNYYNKNKVVEIKVESNLFSKGDELMIHGPTTGVVNFKAEELMQNEKKVSKAKKGIVTIKLNSKARKNDQIYLILG